MLPTRLMKASIRFVMTLLAIGLFAACQTAGTTKPGKNIQSFVLDSTGRLIIPFDSTWQIYPEGTEKDSPYEGSMAKLRSSLGANVQQLFYGATSTEEFFAQTKYIINKRPDADLGAYIDYLKRTAYSHVEAAQDLGNIETAGGQQGKLLQYLYKGTMYFELIYRVENFFLQTTISTPTSIYSNKDEFDVAKIYALEILHGTKVVGQGKGKKARSSTENKKEA